MKDVNEKFDKLILWWLAGVGSIQLFSGALMFLGSLMNEDSADFTGFMIAASSVFWFWLFRVLEIIKRKS